ncbi:MAG: thiol:disulfide interchange protein [Gammaproteobacteria bacterium]|jgi:thiol:disulfide interchange protein DsbD|nr:thiol:disulfide interchange protein [Gammaproteobacteria bacterium]|tara:strand:+ start:6790 stop:8877 length:2088 start_codon:yes stop_codon:yes gene_type:complete
MNLINRSTVTTWIVALLFLPNALAAPVNSGHLEAELISEVSSVKPGEPLWVAVKQVIRPGWHTYWRNPGDAGAQAKLDWQLPTGFTASEIHWPYPERIPYGPLMNFGYHDEVMLLVQITTPGTFDADEVRLQVKGEWLVCEDICIPEDAELELVLPVADAMPHLVMEHAGYFQDARQKLPRDIGVGAQFSAAEDKIILSIQMSGLERSRIESVEFFPYGEGVLDYPRPQKLSVINDGFRLALTPGYRFDPLKSNLDGVIVVTEAAGGGLQSAFVVQPSRSEVIESDEISLPLALVFAFLGGMILNLMPCVFPVLSIKVLSLIESTHANAGVIRIHALIYVLGVVSSFLVIALVLIALRESGEQIGWGFQLQSPIVIGLLCYLFVVIGLNLAGYFEFGTSLMGAGGGLADRSGHSGSFFTGVLAALVAAPCTAPFMGAAIGYALTQNTFTSLAIFTSLGLGMAIPYVLLCFSPPLLDRLPKPGRWMETLRQVFAFPMFATSVWLIWVLNQQTGANGLLAVLTGLLLIVFAIWLLKRQVAGAGRWVGRFVALFLSVIALGLTGVVGTSSSASEETAEAVSIGASGLAAEPYSRERLEELVASGPVFVNFSAAWCITCKVNELAALSSDGIRLTFEKNNVIYLKADWTNEDPAITKALSEYGRSGVPLYLLYKKGSSRASILPQILTESIVIEAIEAL